ncbi:outer membrane beta-barrel protein [Hymenobacter weizhouensis]|uniref:outer membrane beta-barrel protein n=1 Tax=Hymenobacter sp. YIM 151500-1 TaxID=2987689 RepID=UPI002227EF13|nr:outer membrane beta-barrel protein [Hymenobacter sp. YIM 151500-1]UYZ61544.1 outer membrane beta-barrel protein [Hymenobacter sp. YIM 151500-1]
MLLLRYVCLLLLPVLASCSSLYFPPPPQVPLLTQKGEWSGSLQTNFSQNTSAQGAYAFTDHLGVMGSVSFLHSDKKQSFFGSRNNREAVDHDFGELGLGYYTRIRDKRVLEVYGGYGGGRSKRTEFSRETRVNTLALEGTLNKYFVQVNYTSKDKKTYHVLGRDWPVSYGTALRASYVTLTNFRRDGLPAPAEDNIFLEPITYTRIGLLGPIDFQLISGSNFGLKHRKFLKAANSVFQFGLVVNVGGEKGGK